MRHQFREDQAYPGVCLCTLSIPESFHDHLGVREITYEVEDTLDSLSIYILLLLQFRNYLTNGDRLGHDVETVLRQDDIASLRLKKALDRRRVLALGLHEVFRVVLDADAALLLTAIPPII